MRDLSKIDKIVYHKFETDMYESFEQNGEITYDMLKSTHDVFKASCHLDGKILFKKNEIEKMKE